MTPAHSFGEQLRQVREQAGVSLRELSACTNYTRGYLSKIENGHKPANPLLARICDVALRAEGRLSQLVSSTTQKTTAEKTSVGRTIHNDAPETLHSSELQFVPATEIRPYGVGGDETVAEFDTRFVLARDFAQRFPPKAVSLLVTSELEVILALARQLSPAERAGALLLAARYAEFAGWMCQEEGDDRRAKEQTRRAVRLSASADNRDIEAYALVRHAEIQMHQDDSAGTIALAARAQATPTVSDRVRGFALQREAQGHALAGDEFSCLAALDRSSLLLDSADRSTHLLGPTKSPDSTVMVLGWCLFDLGRPAEAAELLEREIPKFAPGAVRARARTATRLALAHVTNLELERTEEIAGWLVDDLRRVDSATIRQDVRRVARALARWPSDRRARALRSRFVEVLSAGH